MNVEFRAFIGQYDWGWVNQQISLTRVEDTCGIMAINSDTNETIGAVIFDNWMDNSVHAHFAITHPMLLRHGFMECISHYIFIEKGCKFMYAWVASDNTKSLKLVKHIGFTEKTRLPDAYADGVDFILMEGKRENCTFIDQPAIKEEAA